MFNFKILNLFAIVAIFIGILFSTDYYVQNGESIQSAIDQSSDGDIITVAAPGEYPERIRFNGKNITVQCENFHIVSGCFLSGDGLEGSIVEIKDGEDSTAVLDGFIILNGYDEYYGGGIEIAANASPILTNLFIYNNTSGYQGGGMFIYNASPTLDNVIVTGNSAENGGGIYIYYNSHPILSGVAVYNNSANDDGGGIYIYYNSDAILSNLSVFDNTAGESGGGIRMYLNSEATLINSIVWGNTSSNSSQIYTSNNTHLMVNYSDIMGGQNEIVINNGSTIYWGEGNINEDPLLNTGGVPQEDSPCLGAGLGGTDMGAGVYGNSIEINCIWSQLGCDGICFSNLLEDECGVCGGPGEIYQCGCADAPDGECDCDGNVLDECGVCGGDGVMQVCGCGSPGEYGIPDGECDCAGNVDLGCGCGAAGPSGCDNTCGSDLENDECGVCGGDNSCEDCAGVPNGDSVVDMCGTCDSDAGNDCIQDCSGVWGGDAEYMNYWYDGDGDGFGAGAPTPICSAYAPEDWVTNNDDTDDECFSNVHDCSGICDGSTVLDQCGVCGGDNSACSGCMDVEACNYDPFAVFDNGNCQYPGGCDNQCGSTAVIDECGICGGPGVIDGYTYFDQLPETATIIDGNSCLADVDLDALSDLIEENNLVDDNIALEVGNQTWNGGRLIILQASYSPSGTNGVNTQLTTLPESFGNLSALTTLYLEWNSLTSLPPSFSQLTNLSSFTINNNWLTELPSDIGNLENVIFLDLGYNQLEAIPPSVCTMESLVYLYLFNNELTALPDCICNLSIDWSGQDGGWSPYFASGGNYLCENVPDCIASSSYFESTLDQFYYSVIQDAPQSCCTDEAACNYDPSATNDNGSCEYPGDEGTEYENECDCDGHYYDCAGQCGGDAMIDCTGECGGDTVEDCFGECGGTAVVDECGLCGGNNLCHVEINFGAIDANAGTVEIILDNNAPLMGFQVQINDYPDTLDLIEISGGLGQTYSWYFTFVNYGRILGFDMTTQAYIPPSQGEVFFVAEFETVDQLPINNPIELCFDDGTSFMPVFVIMDENMNQFNAILTLGDCVTIEECFGDINEDGVVNVIDIVVLVNIILGASDLSPCADINEDGTVDVLDLVALVYYILNY